MVISSSAMMPEAQLHWQVCSWIWPLASLLKQGRGNKPPLQPLFKYHIIHSAKDAWDVRLQPRPGNWFTLESHKVGCHFKLLGSKFHANLSYSSTDIPQHVFTEFIHLNTYFWTWLQEECLPHFKMTIKMSLETLKKKQIWKYKHLLVCVLEDIPD